MATERYGYKRVVHEDKNGAFVKHDGDIFRIAWYGPASAVKKGGSVTVVKPYTYGTTRRDFLRVYIYTYPRATSQLGYANIEIAGNRTYATVSEGSESGDDAGGREAAAGDGSR